MLRENAHMSECERVWLVWEMWELCVWWTQAKHMIMLKDSVMEDVLKFLDHCEGQQAISDPAS